MKSQEVFETVSDLLRDLAKYNLQADVITSALYFMADKQDPEKHISQALEYAQAEWVK